MRSIMKCKLGDSMKKIFSKKNGYYLLAAVTGGAATFALTLLVYGCLLKDYNLSDLDYGVHFISCLANGFFAATVLRWGKFGGMGAGAVVGALTAFLTDAYFVGVSVAMFGTVTVWQGLLQVLIWAAINAAVSALTSLVLNIPADKNGEYSTKPFGAPILTKENGYFALTGAIGGIVAIALTALIYAVILAPFLLSDTEDVNAVRLLMNAQVVVFPLANISHGFLIACVIRWGKFYKPWQGALSAMAVACMTDLYFGFRDVAVKPVGGIKEMTVASAVQDTGIWMVLNIFLGAFISWMLGRYMKKRAHIS